MTQKMKIQMKNKNLEKYELKIQKKEEERHKLT